ncbi:sterol desaturase family protein [Paraburkholderia caribensis]|uniref:sterol desaturase family protein n=1 Tax=Paraburkholderia caribensis TaxID=75105 RepID=UPI001CACB9BD|nr:membrane hypothetical protein [Paraburkholderia caribensis]
MRRTTPPPAIVPLPGSRIAGCGVAQLLISAAVCIPLERRWALTTWEDRHPIRVDVVYAFFVRIVLFPAIAFFEYSRLLTTLRNFLTRRGLPVSGPEALGFDLFAYPVFGFFVAFCFLDLADYWRHRRSHKFGWWYGIHSLHHAEDQMTFWSGDRSHLLEDAILSFPIPALMRKGVIRRLSW